MLGRRWDIWHIGCDDTIAIDLGPYMLEAAQDQAMFITADDITHAAHNLDNEPIANALTGFLVFALAG